MLDSPQNPTGTDAVEIAQAGASGAESIGSITALQGAATITRADGTKVEAADGAPVFNRIVTLRDSWAKIEKQAMQQQG